MNTDKPAGKTLGRAKQIDQANEVMRDIASSYSSDVIFIDLDDMMTGKMESVFVDLAHVTEAGRKAKADVIGEAIMQDLRNH